MQEVPYMLLMECNLTIAMSLDCPCAEYFLSRRNTLLPEIAKKAREKNIEPDELFHAFRKGVHARHGNSHESR